MKLNKIVILFLFIYIINCQKAKISKNDKIRPASHAGTWYQNSPDLLSQEISSYLSNSKKLPNKGYLKSIIAPHAGYRFSGQISAHSFINIDPNNYNRVVILGPSHHEYFQGCGLTSFEKFDTPFGEINIDVNYIKKLLKIKNLFFEVSQTVDINEHSIEMELPFLKKIFGNNELNIIPIIVGDNDYNTNKKIG